MSRPRNSIAVSWKQAASYLPSLACWLKHGAGDKPGILGEGKKRGGGSKLLVAKISLWLGSSAELSQEIFLFSFEHDSYTHKYLPKSYLDILPKRDFLKISSKWETRKIISMP